LVSESGRKPPAVLPRPTASGHVNSVGQGDRPKRSGLKLGSCYFQNTREPDHDIISIATQAGAFVLFIHWRAEPSGAPHPASSLPFGRQNIDERSSSPDGCECSWGRIREGHLNHLAM